MRKILTLIVNHPVWSVCLLLIVIGLLLSKITALEIDPNLEQLMPAGDPQTVYYNQFFKETFGSDVLSIVAVKAKGGDVFTEEVLTAVADLTDALNEIDGVTNVQSLTTVSIIEGEGDYLNTEMLIDDEVSDRELQKEFYNTISQEVSRLSSFIQNLLNMSKIEMGGLTLDFGLLKTDWLVSDCVTAVEKAAEEKQITLTKNLPDNFPTLIGDKELLKTAIINLLGNSVKYTPPGGQINFSMSQEDDEILCEVSDTGYGIAEEELPQIFDKFFRSKNPSILEEKGSGLGLAMTAEIIQLHGGRIEAQSELGKGTHFRIRLPREEFYLGKQT